MFERLVPPPTRRLDELVEGMPGRWRSSAEVGWVLAALLGIGWVEASLGALPLGAAARTLVLYGAVLLLVVAAYALVRPWRMVRLGRSRLGFALCVLLAPLAVLSAVGPLQRASPQPPRIGVVLADGQGDGVRRGAFVTRVEPASPADGRLAVGDLIVAVNGEALAAEGPASDLVGRARSAERLPAGDAHFSVVREGAERSVIVPLAAAVAVPGLREAFRATLLRDVALLLMLGALLVGDGQGLRHVGLEPRFLGTELRAALPALGGLMLAHFLLSVAVTLVAVAVGGNLLDLEVAKRSDVVGALVREHLRFTLPLIVVASSTEEIVFRGFLLPRLRVLCGSYPLALLLGAFFFGLGHVYEGMLATVQTAGVGLALGVIYVWRRRLTACIVAHVGFNSLALLLALLVVSLGLLDQAQQFLER
ncbi:MAG: CPBP family intramembrane metalloprotease [Polyangiaceae bacterium]|nr:CPBP family intramembrane metalloprotease [Polyangiaceae bacterium]